MRPTLKLQPGALFTRDILGEDVNRIRQALLAKGFLSPTLKDPRVERNPDTNEINIKVKAIPGRSLTSLSRTTTSKRKPNASCCR